MDENTRLLRSCEQVSVLRVQVLEGAGVKDSPARLVTYWYEADGTEIARHDPVQDYREVDALADQGERDA